jgi:hypothetical protein
MNANPRFAAMYAPPAPGLAPAPPPAAPAVIAPAQAQAQTAPVAVPAGSAVVVAQPPAAPPAAVAVAAPAAPGLTDYWGRPIAAPGQQLNADTAAWNARQQQFTANNQGYAATGYQGNAAQVATQVAHGAQASSIPLGVLDSTFWQGGTNYGGAQSDQNIASGNNGETNWNDPGVSGFGVDQAVPGAVVSGVANLRNALGASQAQATTGDIGRAVSTLPAAYAGYQAQLQQAASNPQFAGTLPPAPAQQAPAQAAPVQQPVTQTAQRAPGAGPGSVPASQGMPKVTNYMGGLQGAAANA